MQEYLDKFILPASAYNKTNFDEVIKWGRSKLSESIEIQFCNKRTYEHLCGSQDSITNMAMRVNNIRYISSWVNRAIHIGRNGYWCNSELFNQLGFESATLDIMDEDAFEVTNIIER